MKKTDFTTYSSPFSWRYGSEEMRKIFSEEHKYNLWRKVWVELARAQSEEGLVTKEELSDLEKYQDDLDIERIWEIEKDTRHDVVAAIREFAEKAKVGGGKIHLGATSMDINDNADTVRISQALDLIEEQLNNLLKIFAKQIKKYAGFPCMGYTHLQPAEPTTLGYRFAFYAQDLLADLEFLKFVKKNLKAKGIKGAVGTSASYVKLTSQEGAREIERSVMEELGIVASDIANQTAPRKIEFWIGSLLSSIAESLNKFAFDLRIMQSPGFGEWQEPFGKDQVGSSAMPFKKNPWNAEQICSFARIVVNLSRVAWDNAAHMLLERTLDDSANRRVVLPEIFLSTEEMLNIASKIAEGLVIHENKVAKNLETYWPFSVTESIILESVKKGADRQVIHEVCRELALKAWEQIQEGKDNPMVDLLESNPEINKFLSAVEIDSLMDVTVHLGNAREKALELADRIQKL